MHFKERVQRDLAINLFSPGTAITITLMSFFSCHKLVNSSYLLWVAGLPSLRSEGLVSDRPQAVIGN